MLWLIYNDYLKDCLRTSKFTKYLNWYVWVIFSFVMIFTVVVYIAYIYIDVMWLQFITCLFGASGGLYFGNELRRTMLKNVGTHEDVYDNDLITLRQILEKRKVHSSSQVELLLKQTDEGLPELKVSESAIKPFYTISTIIVVPVIVLLAKWLLDKYNNGLIAVIQLTALTIMVFSLFYMIRPLIEHILDLTYRRMKHLKQMLQDILLIDFPK